MSLFKRLLGDPAPSQADLQRQADEEIKQMMGESRPSADTQATSMVSDPSTASQESQHK